MIDITKMSIEKYKTKKDISFINIKLSSSEEIIIKYILSQIENKISLKYYL